MDPTRRVSLAAGVLYLITFVSIPTLALYKPVKDHVGAFVLGTGSDTGVLWGALSEIIVGLAGIGTAVVLYPVIKRVSRTAALGLVTARVLETSLIFAGTAGVDSASLITTGHSLVAVYNWTFLLSQSLMPVACDLLLGYVLYRSGLVPRILPIVAFVGAPLLLASDIAVFFGAYAQVSPLAALAALPIAAFEFSLGIWLVVKGFKATPLASIGAPSAPTYNARRTISPSGTAPRLPSTESPSTCNPAG
jgi:hypothetical protein